jgi:hypothetical protein
MSVNKHRPHIHVLPEDDANRQIANGFLLGMNVNDRAIQILPEVGGWQKAVEKLTKEHVPAMRTYPYRRIVLLIDFDRSEDRLSYVNNQIPDDLKERVFVLGVLSEPEKLRGDINKTFEAIGKALVKDCPDHMNELWAHDLLKHNEAELKRIIPSIKDFLFD